MKLKKWLACLLALTATVSMFGCKDDGDSSSSDDSSADTSVEEVTGGVPEAKNPQDHYQPLEYSDSLHEVNVDYNSPANATFIKDGKTDYKIVLGDVTAVAAMSYAKRHLDEKTGVELPEAELESVTDLSENSTYVFFGCEELYKQAFGQDSMPDYEKIATSGYSVRTYGKNVFIQAYGAQGYQLGSISFLRQTIGFDVISTSITVYEKDGSVLPKMDILERPDYDYRQIDNAKIDDDTAYGMGLWNSNSLFINTGTSWMHNTMDYLGGDPATGNGDAALIEQHRGWFSEDINRAQACFTARGDKEEYALMVQHYANHVKELMIKNPTLENVLIGQMDVVFGNDREARCGCATCDASYEYYGSTLGGAMFSFINDVSAAVDEYLASDEGKATHGEHKQMHILMLVYGQAIRPPIEMDANGGYVKGENGLGVARERMWFGMDEDGNVTIENVVDENGENVMLVANENVEFFYAASSANYLHSFEESENLSFASQVEGWAGLGGSFYLWTYEVNFVNYMYPYNSYDSMLPNMRYFKNLDANHMYYQGSYENPNSTAFAKLRTYICSKGMFDVNVKYEDLVSKFFRCQFGPAGDIMEEYFWQVTVNLRANESITGGGVHSNAITKVEVWPEGLIRKWYGMLQEAFELIEPIKETDPALWEAYDLNLTMESLFTRFVLCTTYADSFSNEELKQMRTDFRDDFLDKCGNTTHREHYTISDVFNTWEFI